MVRQRRIVFTLDVRRDCPSGTDSLQTSHHKNSMRFFHWPRQAGPVKKWGEVFEKKGLGRKIFLQKVFLPGSISNNAIPENIN